ncbi:MAG: PDZ domain-containing protein [Candidatus Omnitrophica bacterium]|nr:PDZ domain-containing protein [Candidatus Omnitrophota bacterium]MDD5488439.1 PDZ domain-containing protein [Candidatus Omnitrophota bacterium]
MRHITKISTYRIAAAIFICFFICPDVSYGDTVVMADNERVKGVVVEEYRDRIVISTMDGEKEIMRSDINNIIYDLEEQNLTSVGDYYQDAGKYEKAYYYYSKALEVNPNYKKAREALNHVGTYIQLTGRRRKLDHVRRLNEEMTGLRSPVSSGDESRESRLEEGLGIGIRNARESFKIDKVVIGSPASKAGLKKGDILSAAWGRAIGYMEPDEVMDKLLTPGVMDINITIVRPLKIDLSMATKSYGNLLGVKLGFSEMEGLMIEKVKEGSAAANAGIEPGDIIMAVDGKSSRYMDIRDVEKAIDSHKNNAISLEIKRDIVIWKKFNNDDMMI